MKRIMLLLLAALFLVFAFSMPAFAERERDIRVFVNKSLVDFSGDVKPFINDDSRTMVPVRFVSEELGALVEWDAEGNRVIIRQGELTIVLVIGNNFAHVNGVKMEFDEETAAEITTEDNIARTVVPVRFISETLGAGVEWVGATRTIFITTEPEEKLPPPVTEITLYFSDDQAQYLVPEIREVELTKPLAEIVFDELMAGPDDRVNLRPTIPSGTKLNLVMFGDMAQLFLSSHFRDNHTRGSAAERMTLYSIVHSLTKLSDINEVLFLLVDDQGNLIQTDAILGHINTTQPLEPDPTLVQQQ